MAEKKAKKSTTKKTTTNKAPKAKPPKEVLMYMTRQNATFEFFGYRFTREHPFCIVKEDDVDKLKARGGFHVATPEQLKEYYGG